MEKFRVSFSYGCGNWEVRGCGRRTGKGKGGGGGGGKGRKKDKGRMGMVLRGSPPSVLLRIRQISWGRHCRCVASCVDLGGRFGEEKRGVSSRTPDKGTFEGWKKGKGGKGGGG